MIILKFIPTLFILFLISASVVVAEECIEDFDLVCPNAIDLCDTTFTGGLGCVVEGLDTCQDSGARSYKLNESTPLEINLTEGIHAIEVFFIGYNDSQGTMAFRNNANIAIDTITSTGDCLFNSTGKQNLRFSEPVHSIAVTANGTVYIDTFTLNPSSVCSSTDAVCDGIDDDCDGAVDEDGNTTCSNGLYCDGVEVCVNGACQAGTAVDCSANDIAGINTCAHTPDDNALTLDFRAAFTSTCDEDSDSCTISLGTITHACDLTCGATCTSDSDCSAGFVCDPTSCGCINSSIECNVDSDCSDGLYCNGVETCVDNLCINGTFTITPDSVACSDEVCNEATDSIESIANDSACDDSNICTADFCNLVEGCGHVNIGAGTITCGVGACLREVPACASGVEQVCTPGAPGIEVCDGIDNDCNGIVDDGSTCDIMVTLTNPQSGIYDTRKVPFNISTNQKVDKIIMRDNADDRPRDRTLCRRCSDYGSSRLKTLSFKDGYHNITITAQKANFSAQETIEFFVDGTKPRITKTEPRRGYATGTFRMEHREINPSEITLYYENDDLSIAKSVDLNLCSEVRRGTMSCEITTDISEFDGSAIYYWFSMSDIGNSSTESRATKLLVDVTAPEVLIHDAAVDRRKVVFNISVSEKVSLTMLDQNATRPRWKTLCRNCDAYTRGQFLSTGSHDLLIRAQDPAGNEDTKEVNVVV